MRKHTFIYILLLLFTACASSHKSIEVEAKHELQERDERLSTGHALCALFDSLNMAHQFAADSIVVVRPTRLVIYGVRSKTHLTRTQTSVAESVYVDTTSYHRHIHEDIAESSVTEKEVKPPDTARHLTTLIIALIILLALGLYTFRHIKQ